MKLSLTDRMKMLTWFWLQEGIGRLHRRCVSNVLHGASFSTPTNVCLIIKLAVCFTSCALVEKIIASLHPAALWLQRAGNQWYWYETRVFKRSWELKSWNFARTRGRKTPASRFSESRQQNRSSWPLSLVIKGSYGIAHHIDETALCPATFDAFRVAFGGHGQQ